MGAPLHLSRWFGATLVVLGGTLAAPDHAAAWGRDGHRIVCEIAWQELAPDSKRAVRALLSAAPRPTRFHEACLWADLPAVKDAERYADDRKRHYVNIPPGSEGFVAARDCREPCVVEGIERYARRLADPELSARQRLEALEFLGHFVGDIHQPLHAGYARDRGGNEFRIRFRGRAADDRDRPYNLHVLWDVLLIDAMDRPWRDIARELASSIRAEDRPPSLDPVQWANESFRLVEERVYRGVRPGQDLRDAYLAEQSRLVRERLKLAGLRLGVLLDSILSAETVRAPDGGD